MANTVNKNITYWLEKIYEAITANTAAVEAQTAVIEAQTTPAEDGEEGGE